MFSIITDNRVLISSRFLESNLPGLANAEKHLADWERHNKYIEHCDYVLKQKNKSDDNLSRKASICKDIEYLAKLLDNSKNEDGLIIIGSSELELLSEGSESHLESFKRTVNFHNKLRTTITYWENISDIGNLLDYLKLLGPIFFSFAFALRLTKVSAEIKFAKKKK